MQEVHRIGAIPGGGDRRMRHHLHQHHHQQALKCPRCDSLNTKFCYYNNYNLSQPRHFCKNCRRYWTKGGVLRNVPVGGGCRKSKRSKPKPKPQPQPPPSAPSPSPLPSVKPPTNSLSSTDSSTITTATATVGDGGMLQISEPESFGVSVGLNAMMESNHQNHHQMGADDQMMFGPEMGGFPGMMCSSGDPLGLMLDQTVRMEDLMESRGSDGGLESLDWHTTTSMGTSEGTAGFFDLLPTTTSGVEQQQQSYWNQTTSSHQHLLSQWSDHATNSEPSLFLP